MLGKKINMNITNCRKNKVASAVTIALMPLFISASFSVFSAETNDETVKTKSIKEDIEVIEVTSFRDSLTSALNAKRSANSVIDSIVADDIGSFPDNNVAESLQRIPGVSITRSLSGDGESISIRGFSPGQNLTLVNGQQLSTSSFNLENNLSRGTNFGVLPSTMVQRVEVHKSSDAYLPEGGVGGTVNIVTRRPLAQKDEFLFMAKSSLGYNTLSETSTPKATLLGSWKASDTFGVSLSFDYSDKESRRDAVEVLSYKNQSFTTVKGDIFTDVLVPGAIGAAMFRQTRKQQTGMLTLQYQPNEAFDVVFDYLQGDMSGDNLNTNIISRSHLFKPHKPGTVLDATLDEASNTISSISYKANPLGPQGSGWAAAIERESALKNKMANLQLKWLGDDLTLKGAVGLSNSSGGFGNAGYQRIAINGPSTVSIDDGIGYVNYHDEDFSDLSDNTTWGYAKNSKSTENENNYITLDAEYFLDDSFISSIMVGAKYTQSILEQRMHIPTNDFHKVTDAHGALRKLTAAELGTVKPIASDFLSGIGGEASHLLNNYQYLTANNMNEYGILFTDRVHLGNSFDVDEKIASVYVQANFEYDFDEVLLRGNFGLRSSNQRTTVSNFTSNKTTHGHKIAGTSEDSLNFNFDNIEEGKSDNLLPSLNVILDLQNDVVIRSAYSTVISRPDYTQLARQFIYQGDTEDNLDDPSGTLRAKTGNPDLNAFEADKYDLSAEWYYNEGSSLSVGLFFYDVKTYVADEESLQDIEGREWTIVRPENKDGGTLTGIEVALTHQFTHLPAPFDGLGVQLNYTAIDSETKEINSLTDEQLPLPGLSDETYNAVLMYSKSDWNARISYNFRSEYYEQVQFGLPRFNDSIERLNAQVKYDVSEGLSVYVQGNNLTDQQNKRYIGDPTRPYQTSEIGVNYTVGFNYQF